MPIYDYKCAKCSKIFEIEHKVGDVPMRFCPSCGGELKKVYNVGGIVFKGSGFHVTDYAKGAKASKAEPKPPKSPEPKSSKS